MIFFNLSFLKIIEPTNYFKAHQGNKLEQIPHQNETQMENKQRK